PVLANLASGVTFTEDGAAVAINTLVTIADVDSTTLTGATIVITNVQTNDSLNFITQNGITGNFSAGTLTLTGTTTLANYQTALRSITFSNSSQNPNTTTRSITFQVNDGGAANNLSNTLTNSVAVVAVNDAPVLATTSTLNYTENQVATAINTAITVTDVDSANLASATVSITANFVTGQDVLGFTTQNGITGSFNSTTGVLTLTGSSSVANYQTALRSV